MVTALKQIGHTYVRLWYIASASVLEGLTQAGDRRHVPVAQTPTRGPDANALSVSATCDARAGGRPRESTHEVVHRLRPGVHQALPGGKDGFPTRPGLGSTPVTPSSTAVTPSSGWPARWLSEDRHRRWGVGVSTRVY